MKQILVAWTLFLLTLATQAFAGATVILSCGTNISSPGSYVLNKNLAVKQGGGDCITITASNVTLDLQGYNIQCLAATRPVRGIFSNPGTTGITVRNGIIANCFEGVELLASTDASVYKIVAVSNTDFGIGVGHESTVMYSIADQNGNGGIATYCNSPGGSNIIYNTAVGNGRSPFPNEIESLQGSITGCNLADNAKD